MVSPQSPKASTKVTEARAVAQRGKLEAQAEARHQQAVSKYQRLVRLDAEDAHQPWPHPQ